MVRLHHKHAHSARPSGLVYFNVEREISCCHSPVSHGNKGSGMLKIHHFGSHLLLGGNWKGPIHITSPSDPAKISGFIKLLILYKGHVMFYMSGYVSFFACGFRSGSHNGIHVKTAWNPHEYVPQFIWHRLFSMQIWNFHCREKKKKKKWHITCWHGNHVG